MRTIEIISHCWRYSRVLCYQLSSLLRHLPTRVKVQCTVCYCPDDVPTAMMLAHFVGGILPDPVTILPWAMDMENLLNRSIGRHERATMTDAAVVWFADCDYWFGEGCLDALADLPLDKSPLYFPRITYFNKTHANGDEYAARIDGLAAADINPADFIEHRPGKAIGGIQIVPGHVARKHGYCGEYEKWQQPCEKWKQTGADSLYRKILGTKGEAFDIPNCYRIRQSVEGRVDDLAAEPT